MLQAASRAPSRRLSGLYTAGEMFDHQAILMNAGNGLLAHVAVVLAQTHDRVACPGQVSTTGWLQRRLAPAAKCFRRALG